MLFDDSITLLEVIFRGVEIACIFLSIEKKKGGKWTIIIVDRIVVVFKFQKFEGNGERHSSLFRYFVTVHLGIVQPRRALSVIRRGTTIPNGRTGNERTRRRTKANARRREWLNRQSSQNFLSQLSKYTLARYKGTIDFCSKRNITSFSRFRAIIGLELFLYVQFQSINYSSSQTISIYLYSPIRLYRSRWKTLYSRAYSSCLYDKTHFQFRGLKMESWWTARV